MSIVNRQRGGVPYNQISLDPVQEAALAQAHTHNNKTILENTTASFTEAEKTKLANLSERFQGIFNNLAVAEAALPQPVGGWYFLNAETSTIWAYRFDEAQGIGYWEDTQSSSIGDMFASVYDPQNVGADAFDRANHTGSQDIATVNGLQDELDSLNSRTNAIPDLTTNVVATKVSTGSLAASAERSVWSDTTGGCAFKLEGTSGNHYNLVITNATGEGRYLTTIDKDGSVSTSASSNNEEHTLISSIDSSAVGSATNEITVLLTSYGGSEVHTPIIYKVYSYRHDSDEVGITIMRVTPMGTVT